MGDAACPDRPIATGPTRPQRRAFTLVELVVVILIIAILAAVAVGRFFTMGEAAEVSATLRHVDAIEKAALDFYVGSGTWPAEAKAGEFPTDFDGYLSPDLFANPTPIGGLFDWNGNAAFADMYAGISIKHLGSAATVPTRKWQRIDDLVDDGDLKTGRVFVYNDVWLCFEAVPSDYAPTLDPKAVLDLLAL